MTSLSHHIDPKAIRRLRRMALYTVITLYLLIIAGGVVRSTGAGMGCPDWPKCFGTWIPPTEVSQLPDNYQEIYGAKLKGEILFNPVKTWIEYVNRLLGVFTGIMIFLTLLASLPFFTAFRSVFYWALAAFLLVGFQGWLGSKVVSFELHPFIVTLHMLLAIVIVAILIYLYIIVRGIGTDNQSSNILRFRRVGFVVLTMTLIQVVLGTQVRENIDEVTRLLGFSQRAEWIDSLDYRFYVHRSFSILVLVINVYWFKLNTHLTSFLASKGLIFWCGVVLGMEILSGVIMGYFNIPAALQPVHLSLGILLLGLQFATVLITYPSKKVVLL